jgi:hypothetical protein
VENYTSSGEKAWLSFTLCMFISTQSVIVWNMFIPTKRCRLTKGRHMPRACAQHLTTKQGHIPCPYKQWAHVLFQCSYYWLMHAQHKSHSPARTRWCKSRLCLSRGLCVPSHVGPARTHTHRGVRNDWHPWWRRAIMTVWNKSFKCWAILTAKNDFILIQLLREIDFV